MLRQQFSYVLLLALLAGTTLGCSVRRFAINKIGDAIASGGTTYESDEDIQLVGDASPFGLKLIESLLAEAPRHKGLLLAACRGFTTYSYVYVQQDADVVAETNLAQANQLRTRARKLYLRAHRYCLRGLEVRYKGIGERLWAEPSAAASIVRKKDVPLLYWNAAALGLAISVSKSDASMLARLPEVEAAVDRALELDESWNDGALHEFLVVFASAKPGEPDFDRIRKHFQRTLELSQGKHAGLFVAYAEAVMVPKQNRAEFRALLEKGLAIDPDKHKDVRLANLVAQQRALRLMARTDDLILGGEPSTTEEQE